MTCATVPPVSERPDIDTDAHRLPMAMATETIMDVVTTAGQMQEAVANQQPASEIQRLRDLASAQFEAYLDLMAEAGHLAGKLKP